MVLTLDLFVDATTEDKLKKDVLKILNIIRPSWTITHVQFKIYTEGISNVLIGAWCDDRDKQILFRAYGENTELFIDRKSEIEAFKLLHKHGYGSELYATFKNGICYEYAVGDPLTPSSVREEKIFRSVAKHLGEFHELPIENKTPGLFPKLRLFLSHYPSDMKEEQAKRLASFGVNKAYLESEVSEMERMITALNCPVVYSHNDLLLQNIIWNEGEKNVTFIDFEYACPNYQPFDIADHFVEFPGVDLEMDYSLCPDPQLQAKWLRVYLASYLNKKEAEIDDDLIKKWLGWVQMFSPTAHLLWICWSIVQAHHSKIDFDFLGYGLARLADYRRRKKELLS